MLHRGCFSPLATVQRFENPSKLEPSVMPATIMDGSLIFGCYSGDTIRKCGEPSLGNQLFSYIIFPTALMIDLPFSLVTDTIFFCL
ncbi:YceK/YidQ family lipoprotein [Lentisphaerota bacterium WC36G]|nr:hypothetical protein LJT99_00365 [Lentisphaerae bacterium WC36]